jgi:hypothetical protein
MASICFAQQIEKNKLPQIYRMQVCSFKKLKQLDLKISLMAFLGFDVVFFYSLLKKVDYFLRSNQKKPL